MQVQEAASVAIGERIQKLRSAHQWTQAELGRRLGKAKTGVAVSNYETGRSRVDADELPLWAGALEVPAAAFYEAREEFVARCADIFQRSILCLISTENDIDPLQLDLLGVVAPISAHRLPSAITALAVS